MLTFLSQTVHHVLFMDPQIPLFSNFFIKNGFHGTIYTFKNYFATVISAISFQFQQNKSYPNRPIMAVDEELLVYGCRVPLAVEVYSRTHYIPSQHNYRQN